MAEPSKQPPQQKAEDKNKKENDILVISYRNHHNTFSPTDPNVTFINSAKPLTPGRRLMQFIFTTIMVHYFLWIIPMCASVVIFYQLGMWYVSVALLAMYVPTFLNNDQYKSGRPWHAFRTHPIWRLTSRYIGIEVVRTKILDPKKKYMFAYYPHGILILSRVAMYGGVWEKCFPGIETRVLGASPMFWVPGSREICLWMSAVDAAKKVAVRIIEKFGLHLMVYPGGSDEIFETDPNSNKTTLVVRKGFIKLAIQTGASIVPAFTFGEKWLYHRKALPPAVQNWFMRKLRMPLILFWGRYFTWLPYHDTTKAFLTCVFGAPIDVEQQAEPSDEYIDRIWDEYIAQIRGLYETHKGKYGYPDDEVLVLREAKEKKSAHTKHAAKKTKATKDE